MSTIVVFLNAFSSLCSIYPFNYFVGGIVLALLVGLFHKLLY